MDEMSKALSNYYVEMVNKCVTMSDIAKGLRKQIDELAEGCTFFGATGKNVIDLVREYSCRNGKMPMTSESIQEAFRPDKVKMCNMPEWLSDIAKGPFGYNAKQKKVPTTCAAMPKAVFATKVQSKLYSLLLLDDVLTDYVGAIFNVGDSVQIMDEPTMASAAYTSSYINFRVGDRIIIPIKEGMTVEKAASKVAAGIIDKHRYKWKAFATQIFYRSEGYLDVIYGVLEAKAAPGAAMYGAVDFYGNWFPNNKLLISPGRQYELNVENGHLCGKCMMGVSRCMCGEKK